MRTPNRIKVDGKTDVIRDEQKLNHASAFEEIRIVTDGERIGVVKCRKVRLHALFFGNAKICDGAFFRIRLVEIRSIKPKDAHRSAIDDFTGCDVVERSAEGVFSDNANVEVVVTGIRTR